MLSAGHIAELRDRSVNNFSSSASGLLHTVGYVTWTQFSAVKEKGNNIFYCQVT